MGIRSVFRAWRTRRFTYEPLITVTLRRDRLLHNLEAFEALDPRVAVAPVLKANAYGHGLVKVASILEKRGGIPFFCIDSYAEALVLRNEGVRTPLVVIGFTPLANVVKSRLKDVAFAMTSLEDLVALSESDPPRTAIHLKIDTGMHRQGIMPDELARALALVRTNPSIALEGAYSHFADADTEGSKLTKQQIESWNAAIRQVRAEVPSLRYAHLANTAGSFHAAHVDANVMRLGIGLYGVNPSLDRSLHLLPVLSMKTQITSVRTVRAGESVGYNATFVADRETTVATVPAGYAEGVDRRLSGKGHVVVRGVPCPIAGRVSMNITSVDVSSVPDVRIADEAVLIGDDPAAPNSVVAMADACATIPYEILVHIPAGLRRVVADQ